MTDRPTEPPGDRAEKIFLAVYEELRALARRRLQRERDDHTLQPTALVHEAWLRLAGRDAALFSSRAEFLAAASEVMRRVLVDHARSRLAYKRRAAGCRVPLEDAPAPDQDEPDVLDLDRQLTRLAERHPRAARVAELRWFGGATREEAARALDLSLRQVRRDAEFARAWLRRELAPRRDE